MPDLVWNDSTIRMKERKQLEVGRLEIWTFEKVYKRN
jgi:hypothetical protein